MRQRQIELTTGLILSDAGCLMLEIRPARKGFIVFDTDEREPIMRFDNRADATDLVAELVMAESREQLQAWQSPQARKKVLSRALGD
jgi:hypothetical protein